MSLIKDFAIGIVSGVVVSVFFYRKSLLDQLRLKLLYLDPTTHYSNLSADRDRDGLDYTLHYLNWYQDILETAGMCVSAKVVRQIASEIKDHIGTLPTGGRAIPPASLDCEVKKRYWIQQVGKLYALPNATREFWPILWSMTFGASQE